LDYDELLNEYVVRRAVRSRAKEIRYVKTIFLPPFDHDPESTLSELVPVLCCVSLDKIFLMPSNEGSTLTITPSNKNERPYKEMDPIIATDKYILHFVHCFLYLSNSRMFFFLFSGILYAFGQFAHGFPSIVLLLIVEENCPLKL